MPRSAARICTGCNRKVRGDCAQCNAARQPARRKTAERGYGSRWRRHRLVYLNANPLCAWCSLEGRTGAATLIDHIVRHQGDQWLFWNQDNWQPMCRDHHGTKTALEVGRETRPPRDDRVIVCGKPGAGKTTYVSKQRKRFDDVWDMDAEADARGFAQRWPRPENELRELVLTRGLMINRLMIDLDRSCLMIFTHEATAIRYAKMIGARVDRVYRGGTVSRSITGSG